MSELKWVLRRAVQANNKSGSTGVFFNKKTQLWQAWIQRDLSRAYLGSFHDRDEADRAYSNAEQLIAQGYRL